MYCPTCGANNVDNAAVCIQCGRAFGVVVPAGGPAVENYLVFAILATVFCCLPTGIASIVYAAQVNTKLQAGDVAGAQLSSKNAKMWAFISLGLGLLVPIAYFMFLAFTLLIRHHR